MNNTNGKQPIPATNTDDAGKGIMKAGAIDRAWVMQNTLVMVKDRSPDEIMYLDPGDEVLARCETTGEIGYRKIAHIHTKEDVPTYLLYYKEYDGNLWDLVAIEAAANVPFFVMGKGWTYLKDVRTGDELKSFDLSGYAPDAYNEIASFNCATQTVLDVKKSGLTRKVYSLELEDFDTYFIRYVGFLIPQQVIAADIADHSNAVADTVPDANLGGFSMSTLVHVKEGLHEMECIGPGSTVLSRCRHTGKLVYRKVLSRIFHECMPSYQLTQNHPDSHLIISAAAGQQFLLKDRGWTRVSDIQRGDAIATSDGLDATVTGVDSDGSEQRHYSDYYTLEIEDGDCYFVDVGLCVRSF